MSTTLEVINKKKRKQEKNEINANKKFKSFNIDDTVSKMANDSVKHLS